MNKIYFTADLHFGHSNILKHSPKRPFSDTVDIVAHDEWLLDLWKSFSCYKFKGTKVQKKSFARRFFFSEFQKNVSHPCRFHTAGQSSWRSAAHPAVTSSQVASKSPVYQGSATSPLRTV